MNQRQKQKRRICISLALTCLIGTWQWQMPVKAANDKNDAVETENDVVEAEEEIIQYYASENRVQQAVDGGTEVRIGLDELVAEETDAELLNAGDSQGYGTDVLKMEDGKEAVFQVMVPKEGYYYMAMDYFIPGSAISEPIFSLEINGEYQFYDCKNLALIAVWKDVSQDYKTDQYGNELYPEPERIFRWQNKKMNSTLYNLAEPFKFHLKAGENTVVIRGGEYAFYMGNICFTGAEKTESFEEYRKRSELTQTVQQPIQIIEAEKYTEKTHSYIRGAKTTDHELSPYDASRKLINALAGGTWEKPNEGVTYRFTVEESGVYYITLKYLQEDRDDLPVFKQIRIDGEYPIEELKSYAFPYTKKDVNETLNVDGEAIPFYLEAGEHEVSFTSTCEAEYLVYENLMKVMDLANDISLEIKVISGGKADKNRDWEIDQYLPDLNKDLEGCIESLRESQQWFREVSENEDNKYVSYLDVAIQQLELFIEDNNYMVNNLDMFVSGSNSVTEYISLVLEEMLYEPLGMDCIYITTDTEELPAPGKGFWYNLTENVKKFFLSFWLPDESGDVKKTELNVWANRSTAHIDVLKEMVLEFEEDTGIKVNLSMMPDEQKLLLATSAGNDPDVVIGMSNYRPFDFALRGAMYDLREFDDFSETLDSFHSEMLIPFVVGDSCYALPETANFQVLFYRKDILNALGLSVPDTWDDVIAMLPTLSRYDMDFGTTIATAGGVKHFGATMPFIQQYEGKIYSEDGTRVELGDPNTVKAFELMTDLYTKYSLPESIPNFYNNFKKSITPIGIGDINTYILLKNAAPELAGQWGIAPSVGMENEEGEILRYQASVASASGIMGSTEHPEEAWEFLKWYMSDEIQSEYANQLQLRFGPEYIWNTANMNVMRENPAFSREDREVIMEQLEQTMEIPRNPAYFSVEREVSNAWNSVVFDGVAPRTALDTAITKSNRVITKKLKEFGYVDENGNKIKDFRMATGELIDSWR